MRLWDELKESGSNVRKLPLPLGPDSYFQYKPMREYARKNAERGREQTWDSAEREHEVERGRRYGERAASTSR